MLLCLQLVYRLYTGDTYMKFGGMKMKKFLTLALATTMALTLFACGSTTPATGDTATSTDGGTGTTSTGDSIVLTIGHVEAEDRSTHRALLEMKAELEEASGGRFQVEVHANGSLGGDMEMIESVSMGMIQMCLPSTSVLTAYTPEFGVLDMPFLFSSAQSAFSALDGDVGDQLGATLESKGFINMGYTYNGPRSMTNSVHPINTPDDLAGMKVRVMESPVFITLFETLGANATPMSFSELFTALQNGTVAAQENPPSLIYASRFQEVQSYLSLTEHVHNCLSVLTSLDFYEGLSEEDKALFDTACANLVTNQRAMELEDNQVYIDKLAEEGMEVNEISPENFELFVAKLEPMYEQYEGEFGQELFDLCRAHNT